LRVMLDMATSDTALTRLDSLSRMRVLYRCSHSLDRLRLFRLLTQHTAITITNTTKTEHPMMIYISVELRSMTHESSLSAVKAADVSMTRTAVHSSSPLQVSCVIPSSAMLRTSAISNMKSSHNSSEISAASYPPMTRETTTTSSYCVILVHVMVVRLVHPNSTSSSMKMRLLNKC